MRVLRFDGSQKRRVYETPMGDGWVQEWPTGRCRAWWEGPEGEREDLGDFPGLEEAYEALEEAFIRRVAEVGLDEEDLEPPF
ncbi:hypothetical protein [Thermus scotoductus]|uniref:Uncharacterized protein n=1 Tax=Thermus scotoductus TaxID=37636 RepID=A0A430V0D0_THESC|nr:hypothetical protein [Thermus scotoductus]RTI15617.1 hypothetical protein CSW27_05445 [Thermus scotoductus]